MAMLVDPALLCVVLILASHPSLGNILVIFAGMWAWYREGMFLPWRPSVIRQFMKNAKKMGL